MNTATEYENKMIAIWNIQMVPVNDMDILASCIIHEMFHCFQIENNESRFPNDLKLFMYPNSIENYALKYQENQILIQVLTKKDILIKQKLLEEFYSIRKYRKTIIKEKICF